MFDRPEIVDFGVWAALGGPGRPGNLPQRWGAKPPTFVEGSPACPGPPRPRKIDDLRSVKNSYIKYPREMALELVSGAAFLCKLMCGVCPVDLRGSAAARGRPDPKNLRFPVGQTIITKTQVFPPAALRHFARYSGGMDPGPGAGGTFETQPPIFRIGSLFGSRPVCAPSISSAAAPTNTVVSLLGTWRQFCGMLRSPRNGLRTGLRC